MVTIAALPLFERASTGVLRLLEGTSPGQLSGPTPCTAWDVQALIDHLAGGPGYLLGALGEEVPAGPHDATSYTAAVKHCLTALRAPDAGAVRCVSPPGFEWSVAEATAGTFMDQLVHAWDLATATGQDSRLDPDLVDACITMLLPEMPERGRAAGLIGPAVPLSPEASPQELLLAAMGRRP